MWTTLMFSLNAAEGFIRPLLKGFELLHYIECLVNVTQREETTKMNSELKKVNLPQFHEFLFFEKRSPSC